MGGWGSGGASGRALHCCLAYNCHINLPGQDKSHSPGSGAAIVAAPADWRAARPARWHEEQAGRAGQAAQSAQWQSHFALKSPKGRLAKIETSLEEMPSSQSALRACGPRQLRSNRKCTKPPFFAGHYIMYVYAEMYIETGESDAETVSDSGQSCSPNGYCLSGQA